jgi:hypothetical protein
MHKSLAADALPQGNDSSPIRLRDAVQSHDKRVGTLPQCGVECARQILSLSHVEKLGLDTQGARRELDLFPLEGMRRVTHVEDAGDSGRSWKQLSDQLDPFPIYFRVEATQPGDPGARG